MNHRAKLVCSDMRGKKSIARRCNYQRFKTNHRFFSFKATAFNKNKTCFWILFLKKNAVGRMFFVAEMKFNEWQKKKKLYLVLDVPLETESEKYIWVRRQVISERHVTLSKKWWSHLIVFTFEHFYFCLLTSKKN